MIESLYETHLYVEDLTHSIDFYSSQLNLELCHREEARKAAFFWIGPNRVSMLGLWEKPKDEIDIRHFAFKTSAEWVREESVNYLTKRGIKCRNFLNDGTNRPMVFAWMPAVSSYFDDPDGHILEFIGLLEGPGRPELGVVSLEEWERKTSEK